MKSQTAKQVTHWLGVIILGLFVGLAVQFVRAWTEPTSTPPGGNVGAPINVSDTDQAKAGALSINYSGKIVGLTVLGNVGVGTLSPLHRLDVSGTPATAGDVHATGDICTDQGGGVCLSTAPKIGYALPDIETILAYESYRKLDDGYVGPSANQWNDVDLSSSPSNVPSNATSIYATVNVWGGPGKCSLKMRRKGITENNDPPYIASAVFPNVSGVDLRGHDINTVSFPYDPSHPVIQIKNDCSGRTWSARVWIGWDSARNNTHSVGTAPDGSGPLGD